MNEIGLRSKLVKPFLFGDGQTIYDADPNSGWRELVILKKCCPHRGRISFSLVERVQSSEFELDLDIEHGRRQEEFWSLFLVTRQIRHI